jgi:hypothetical protein
MKRLILACLLFATPALAQPTPPPIPMPQDVLQRISVYLQEGGSHNEGFALNKAILDAIALQSATRERDALKTQLDAAKPKTEPAAPATAPHPENRGVQLRSFSN